MGQANAKKATLGSGGEIRSYVPEISEDFFKTGGEVVFVLQDAIQKFQGQNSKLACPTLLKLETHLGEILSKMEVELQSVPKDDGGTMELLVDTTRLLKVIKEKSLQKLGQACCRNEGKPEECALVVAQLLEKIAELSNIIKSTRMQAFPTA